MERVGRCLDDLTNAHFCPKRQQKSSRHNLLISNEPKGLESTLHIETLKLGGKRSGDSVLVLMRVTYLAYLLRVYSLPVHSYMHRPRYYSGLGSAPTATVHAQNVSHSETKLKVRAKKKNCVARRYGIYPRRHSKQPRGIFRTVEYRPCINLFVARQPPYML